MKPAKNSVAAVDGLYRSVRKVIEEVRKVLSVAANTVLGRQNWFIGKLIVEDEQKGRREIETQKELYCLQMLDEKLPEPQRPIRSKKKGGAK